MSLLKISPKAHMNYLAKVVTLSNVRKHNNADRLKCVMIDGNNVIVGSHVKDGDLGIFFPLESKINHDFLHALSLFRDKELNKNKDKTGFFEPHCRVRALKLRDERSEGFWIELDFFCQAFDLDQKELAKLTGTEFDLVFDARSGKEVHICTKYIPKLALKDMRLASQKKQVKKTWYGKIFNKWFSKPSILIDGQFNFHIDTPHFAKNIHRFSLEDHISITQKMHGTSFVVAKVLTKKQLSWREKVAAFCRVPVVDTEYKNLYSSRKVIKNLNASKSHYYKVDIWELVNKKIVDSLRPGMTVYGEIVGYVPDGSYIQKKYDYNCQPGEHQFYIYRITTTDPQGHVLEWSWYQIKAWCAMAGFNHVPELYDGILKDWKQGKFDFSNLLEEFKSEFLEKKCWNCKNDVWDEGIVIRKDNSLSFNVFKLKSFNFWQYETKMLDEGVLDLEAQESLEILEEDENK